MGIKTTVVIFNEETNKHEPITEGDVLSETLLPPLRKAWLGNVYASVAPIDYGIDSGNAPDLEVGSTYFVSKNDPTDDFSNVGQGADGSIAFVATGTTPAQWKNSYVFKVVDELTVTEHHNTMGFTVEASLRLINNSTVVVLTTSVPYWNQPLAVYDSRRIFPESDTEGHIAIYGAVENYKVLFELL